DRMNAVTAVYTHSGQAADIRYRYYLPIVCDYISETGRFITWKDMMMASGGLSDKEKAQIDALSGTLEEMINQVSPAIAILEDVERGFPDYAAPFDYRLNPAYASLIQSLWTWHENIRPDSARARHYIRLITEIQRLNGQPMQADWTMAQYHNTHKEAAEAYAYAARCRQAPEAFTALQQLQICQLFGQMADLLGHEDEAVRAAVEQAGHIRRYVRGNFDFLSSGERAEFLTTYGNSGAAITAHLDRHPGELAAEAYDAALFDKGLLLHSWERLRRAILRSGDSLLAARLDTLDLLRKQQRHTAIVPLDSSAMRKQVGLMQRMEGIEKALARQAAQFRPDTMRVASWREVQARLAADEAAIEFTFADTALAALVVRPGMDRPRYVRLGSSQACYDLLHRSERLPADTRVRRLYTYGRTPLYDLVWRPLEAELRGVRRVYYSPIAMLHRVAFAALPVGPDSCLVDRYDLCPLSTTAELLRPRREEAVRTAALFGGVHYSPGQGVTAATGTATEETEAATGKTGSRQRAALEEEFDYLSETLAETEAIARTMEAAGLSPLTFKGEKATEPAFYTLDGQSPDVIHLATHGFYINADDVENNAFLMNHPGSRTQSMQRTGLAFAGANATWRGLRRNDREDGILTANELSLLDLSRTKLAVLSACETALGDYSTEGVWGLQRGFKEAGVGTLILSLWNVNDRATALFMQAFYDQWLNGKPKRAAFSHAVDTLRRSHPNPFFWAAFVLLDAND
ncbi:MAG TPA: CHAT domain-containing protein, partial [Candidatus Caccomonas pullistercoris]|nr:CHAT domain-containing protein [Candidatus Caccomonas pullistercoris]